MFQKIQRISPLTNRLLHRPLGLVSKCIQSTQAQVETQPQHSAEDISCDHLLTPSHDCVHPPHAGHEEIGSRHQPWYEIQKNEATQYSEDVIIPKFWYGEVHNDKDLMNPRNFTIDLKGWDKKDVTPENHDLVEEMCIKYNNTGLCVLKNSGLTEFSDMRRIMDVLIPSEESMEYEGGSNWRNYIDNNVYDTGAPYNAWIHYHHEMAYVQYSPLLLGFACKHGTKDNPRKGATFVSNGILATEALLETELGQKLKDKGICYHRNLTDRSYFMENGKDELEVYNHWQQSFNCEKMSEAQFNAEKRGLKVEWDMNHEKWGNYMKTKFYIDTFEYCPDVDRNLLYASVADHHMWFDSWPGVSSLDPKDRPLEITYGDDTKFTFEECKLFVDVYDRYGIPIDWQTGDMAIMCNYRWAHGRPAFNLDKSINEQREIGVVLGPMFKREGQREDKW